MDRATKVTLVLPIQHRWLSGLRGSSLIIEYLLDKEFGTDLGDSDQADLIAAAKIVKAQKIVKKMRERRKKEKDVPDKRKRT